MSYRSRDAPLLIAGLIAVGIVAAGWAPQGRINTTGRVTVGGLVG